MDQNSDIVTLKNHIAELEEEKGNLQLQLLDTDESKAGQSCYRELLLLFSHQISAAFDFLCTYLFYAEAICISSFPIHQCSLSVLFLG